MIESLRQRLLELELQTEELRRQYERIRIEPRIEYVAKEVLIPRVTRRKVLKLITEQDQEYIAGRPTKRFV